MEMREYDVQFGQYRVHCYEAGSGAPLLLIHGIGPGTSIPANFASVMAPLAENYHVFACDLIGFGASQRKRELPYFDFEMWFAQMMFMVERLPAGPVNVIGHSMGGSLALRLARANPRVSRVITSGAAGGTIELNRFVDIFWTAPRTRDDIRAAMRVGMFDHAGITDALIEERFRVVETPGYSDYFETMLGGNRQAMFESVKMSAAELSKIEARVLVMHGRNDLPCPPEETALPIYQALPKADLHLLHDCGHAIPREYPKTLLTLAGLWFA
jgi:2-hydroxymuconate-semialdehyde hydrolase